MPDLVEENGGWWPTRFGTEGSVMALDEFLAKDKDLDFPNDFTKGSIATRVKNGKTYAIPLHATCNGLIFYNRGLLDKAGVKPPTTWDEFKSAAVELTKDGVFGCALNQSQDYGWPWLLQANGVYYDPKQNLMMQPRDAAITAYKFQQELVNTLKVSPKPVASTEYSGPQKLFSAKKAAMIVTGPWDIAPIGTGSPDIDLGISQPLLQTEQGKHITPTGGSGLMIPTKSQNPELAWELIKRLTTLEVELETTKAMGMTMPRLTWASNDQVKNDPIMGIVAEGVKVATPVEIDLFDNSNIASIYTAYQTFYQSIVAQGLDVEQAATNLDDAVKSYL